MYFHIFKKLKKRNIFFHYCAIALLSFLFYMLLTSLGHAAEAFRKEAWKIDAVRDGNQGFLYCKISAPFSNELQLIFAQDLENTLNLAIEMPAEVKYFKATSMKVVFDQFYQHQTEAFLDGKHLIVLPLVQEEDLYKKIQKAQSLKIIGPQDEIAFNLKDLSAAISKLRECTILQRVPKDRVEEKPYPQIQPQPQPQFQSEELHPIVPPQEEKPLPLKIKQIKPIVPEAPQNHISSDHKMIPHSSSQSRPMEKLPEQIRFIYEDPKLFSNVHIEKEKVGVETLYQWEMMHVKVTLREVPLSMFKAEQNLSDRITNRMNEFQSKCGPEGVSFIGPMNKKADGVFYNSSSFVCDLPKDAWAQSIVLFYEPRSSKLFEIKYEGSEKISKRIDGFKQHAVDSIQKKYKSARS